jgi:hypothetical protein
LEKECIRSNMTGPSAEELINELLRLHREIGNTPTAAEMDESGEYWASKYQDKFGSWNNAIREAGLEPNQRKIPTDDLLNEIRRLARELNKTPTKNYMDREGEYYGRSYLMRFGSWNEAVRQAGLEPNQRISDSEFQEPPESCPLCGDTPEKLDFHHWRYGENKAGCYLCRDCHDSIHAGSARPDKNPDWLIQAVENLLRKHDKHHADTDAHRISRRYNIPSAELVGHIISKTTSPE